MARHRRQPLAGFLGIGLAVCLLGAATTAAAAQDAAQDDADRRPAAADTTGADGDQRPWLIRTLNRYFGSVQRQGEALEGRALEVSGQYARYAGLPIEVIIVHPVPGFEEAADGDVGSADRLLRDLTSPFQDYTREGVIRDYLLFDRGQPLDPFALADSERLLRSLDFIADVRIVVVKLSGSGAEGGDSVAVVVEPMDRYPLGVSGKIHTADRYTFKLFTVNLLGSGTLFENELIVNRDAQPRVGYRGRVRKQNVGGTFLDIAGGYEDSYARLQRTAALERLLVHPRIKGIGGVAFESHTDRENEGVPRKYEDLEAWFGYAIRLYEERDLSELARPMLVPAVRLTSRDFLDRPAVTPDSNRAYHDRRLLLGGLSLVSTKYYESSYFFGDGEIENLPSGFVAKVSGGFEKREFADRPAVFGSLDGIRLQDRGDLLYGGVRCGGYFEDGVFSDGVLDIESRYFTPLWGGRGSRFRLNGRVRFTRGLSRHRFDRIYLDDAAGIRGLASGYVAGNQRLVANLESRLFTSWAVLGFRASFLGFVDLGLIGGEDAASLFEEKLYASAGLGVRFRNPDLVLPTLQLRLATLNKVAGSGFELQITVGSPSYRVPAFPSAKPGALAYE